ncbi:MAG: Chromosome (plasmid) partitioning protein ParB [uncultured Aureispira sp.]|uniref:Chromosome (Plasmid) partitioning protein ParB n=1 Tax=uncultured Aureispira sp. TaxID=1331704 RepID=A0A6S6U2A5_9BACT|nr:MAG: Chromosome (plasmid) partitioning protein ParB [uncultured Aureispira sp.]
MAKRKNKGLGIGALLGNIDGNIESAKKKQAIVNDLSNTVAFIPLTSIEVNPFQPRVDFDQLALKELSDSIAVHGLIQPITVRHLGNNKFQLISGERRLRASKMADLEEIPAFIRLANDQEMIEMALIENIQRQQLNPIEVAITYGRLMKECDLTHLQLAERVGKARTTITNFTRLLSLPEAIQKGLKENNISMGHAKALLGVDDYAFQMATYKNILEKELSVRQTEDLVKLKKGTANAKGKGKKALPQAYQKVQSELTSMLSTRVNLKADAKGKGQIVINFTNTDDLNRILDLLEASK